jgi:type I restriction enzyme S subunit
MNSYYLKDVLEIKNGRDHKGLEDGEIPVFGSGGLMRYVNQSIYDDESILLPRKGTLSNIQYFNQPFWTVDTLYYTVVDKSKASPYYLYHYLKRLDLSNLNSGTGVPSMTFGAYYGIKLQLPDLPTQQKIASVLSALDDKIELNNKINAELEAMAKTLFDYWFEQFDFPDGNGKPYKSSGGTMIWNEALKRDIPEGWAAETISDLGSVIGGSTPSKAIPENFSNSGTPWITPKDLSMNIGNKFISKGETDVSEIGLKKASLNILDAGSVLMSSRAPIGYLAINRLPCTTNQGFKSVVCNKNYTCEYVFYVLKHNMPKIEANASGSTFKEISTGVLRSIKVVKPLVKIVNKYVEKVGPIFQKQNNLEIQNNELAQLRDWLLPMLMNGQVTVSEAEEKVEMVAEGAVDYANINN